MKIILKNTVTIILFITAALLIGTSCNSDTPTPDVQICTDLGLKYQIDNNSEVYIAYDEDHVVSTSDYTVSNNSAGDYIRHVLGTPSGILYLFYSSSINANQTSNYQADFTNVLTIESSSLYIANVLDESSTNVSIIFTCTNTANTIGDTISYEFEGTFDDNSGISHTINGSSCQVLKYINN